MYFYNPYLNYGESLNNEYNIKLTDTLKNNVLRVEGAGSVKASPDEALVFLGVITDNIKLSEAQQENAEKANKLIKSLLAQGVNERNIQTQNYSVDLQYDFIDGKQIFRGYRVTNNLKVTLKDMNSIGKIIDIAIENGANVVYNVNFALSNMELFYNKALSLALFNAQEKARSIGNTMNLQINNIPIEIVEENSAAFQTRELNSIKSPASPTPIMTGEIEIIARVNVVFKYM